MERRLDTFMVMASRRVCSLCRRISLFSVPSRLRDEDTAEEGGGERRGMILTVVPLRASVCRSSWKSSGPLSLTETSLICSRAGRQVLR